MESIVKKAGVKISSDMITAATDVKGKGARKAGNIFFGGCLFIVAVLFGYTAIVSLASIFTRAFDGGSVGFIFLFLMSICVSIFCFLVAKISISSKSGWFLILYRKHMLYKYREKGSYEDIKVPLTNIKKCYLLRKRVNRMGSGGRRMMKYIEFHMSVHFQYEESNELKYISLINLDGNAEVNKALRYLQKEKNIPIYFANANPVGYEIIEEIGALEGAEEIVFTGDLLDYDKKNYREW